ncbi:hypothetical protein LOK49_LG03G00720 [Camellia lanceoleosa]|uniref:Uncharacterized protein n=1 Tax=Camellia lanceoleosa TaxID=1840588 RepID=A0ACC0I9Q3_9ERIC|nr:hypothetical protein LOK49_LG03G00720 [Camellia lanceoleosa]
MAVPTIALYASPRSSVCSTPHPCQINPYSSFDFDSSSSTIIGGLSCLLSAKHASCSSYSNGGEEFGSLWHGKGDELTSSFRFSSFCSSLKRDQSPVSVLQGPGSSRSPPMRIALEMSAGDVSLSGSIRAGANGFGHHALGSCVDYDLPSFCGSIEIDSSSVLIDELPFTMDDNFVELSCEPYAKDLLLGAQSRHGIFREDFLVKAFYEAEKAHRGQVSKLSQLSKLAHDNNTASKTIEADRLHTMFLAMADARAQQRFAKETLEIFAPLANRLGISSWKEKLENLCFKYLYPDEHKEIFSKLVKSFDEAMVASAVEKLEQVLEDAAISYHDLSGRHKSLYSIYVKMLKKKLTMDEIHDIHGLRLIVEKEEDCYKALRVFHQLWSEVPGKFKDYINQPKFNGYQSLHTVVMGEGMVALEVQIQTKDMHLRAEFGFAAHWRYKEGDCKHASFVLQMVEWARWVVTIDQQFATQTPIKRPPCTFPSYSEDCPYSYKNNCVSDGPLFVIVMENDKMSVQEFPANSTILDLMERAGQESFRWTSYGFPVKEELRPRLNHKPVSDPTCKIKMRDVVELTPV